MTLRKERVLSYDHLGLILDPLGRLWRSSWAHLGSSRAARGELGIYLRVIWRPKTYPMTVRKERALSYDHFGLILDPGGVSSSGQPFGVCSSGQPFGVCSSKPQMSFQRPSESNLATRAQKSSKWASRGHLRAIWLPEPRRA